MADLTSTRQLVRRHATAVVNNAARRVETETRAVSPYKTGRLADRTEASPARGNGDAVTFELTADTDYAGFMAEGTRAHVIVPRRAKVLRFVVGGQVVFARRVFHPGTRPHPDWWSEPALATRFRSALTRAVAATTTSG